MLLSLILTALLSPSFAVNVNQTVQVADGSVVLCQSSQDAFHNRMGAYRLAVQGPNLREDWLLFNLQLDFFACQEEQGSWGFVKIPTFAPLKYTLPHDEVLVETKEAYLQVTRNDQFITQISWSDDSRGLALGLSDVVSAEEMEQLQKGETVDVEVDFGLVKDLQITSKSGVSLDKQVPFGAFRQRFQLKL